MAAAVFITWAFAHVVLPPEALGAFPRKGALSVLFFATSPGSKKVFSECSLNKSRWRECCALQLRAQTDPLDSLFVVFP
ncbi:hypothetical protein GW7_19204 [Heterocephalus glaber]|uniref:Secreted protein n=1 Tax=Heterocephalus glaber TaxID=10181 RepID=G5C468_HETGA|nr:hypothetical protein GW7_19204 [Heterocephalus glaber]